MSHRHRRVVPELVAIPGGTLQMGSERGLPDERPVREVVIAAFRAAVRPMSNREYAAFQVATSAATPPFVADPRFAGPDQPVVGVSWHDAVAFCEWASGIVGMALRLPTEAEREWAARGGLVQADWPWGDTPPLEHPPAAAVAGLDRPHVPGPACVNAYGLHCMADNVHEWCSDWYAAEAGGTTPGTRRASRGGSWRHAVPFTRVSARSSLDPTYRYSDYGFRVHAEA